MSDEPSGIEVLLRLARSSLERMLVGTTEGSGVELPPIGQREACITLRVGGRTRGCFGARARTIEEAVAKATIRAAMDSRYGGPLCLAELPLVTIELWLLQGRSELLELQQNVLFGSRGCEVWLIDRRAFLLPSVAIERECGSVLTLQQRLFRKGRIFSERSKRDARLFETQWVGIVEGQPAKQFTRWGVLGKESDHTDAVVASAAQRVASHLLAIQSADGTYLYKYHPLSGHRERSNSHPVRQIGCTLALVAHRDAYQYEDDASVAAIQRGRAFVRSGYSLLGASPTFHGSTYAGSLALAALTLDAGCAEDARRIGSILEAFRAAQSSAGWFPQNLIDPSCQGQQDFAAGQILLAFEKHMSAEALLSDSSIERAFAYYGALDFEEMSGFYLAWQAKAWSRIAFKTGNSLHTELALKLIDKIGAFQIRSHEDEDFIGGYVVRSGRSRIAPTFLTALFTEAVLQAVPLARRDGHKELETRLGLQIDWGLRFLLRLQLQTQHSYLFPEPSLAIGGIRRSLGSFAMRCDYSMHTLTCLSLYRQVYC